MNYTDNEIESLLKGIFNGAITAYEIPETLYFAIADYLKRGVYSGFGSNLSTVSSADLELLTSLRENIYMFSAAKSYTELKDMSSLLVQDGKLASWQEFYKEAKHRFDIYNVDYAKTEYRTAVGQAQMAAQWNEIERTKDIIPFLKYSAIMDPNTSTICAPLDGIVAEVSDPIWNTIMPLNHFNCRCVVTQEYTGEPTKDREQTALGVEGQMQDVFKHNSGKDGMIYPKSHPYFDVPAKDREYAKNNFNLPIPKDDI